MRKESGDSFGLGGRGEFVGALWKNSAAELGAKVVEALLKGVGME